MYSIPKSLWGCLIDMNCWSKHYQTSSNLEYMFNRDINSSTITLKQALPNRRCPKGFRFSFCQCYWMFLSRNWSCCHCTHPIECRCCHDGQLCWLTRMPFRPCNCIRLDILRDSFSRRWQKLFLIWICQSRCLMCKFSFEYLPWVSRIRHLFDTIGLYTHLGKWELASLTTPYSQPEYQSSLESCCFEAAGPTF